MCGTLCGHTLCGTLWRNICRRTCIPVVCCSRSLKTRMFPTDYFSISKNLSNHPLFDFKKCFQPSTFRFQKMFPTNHFALSKGYFPIFAHICQKCHVSNQPLTLSYFQMVFLDVRAVALLYCLNSIVRAWCPESKLRISDVKTNLMTKCSVSRMCERSRPTDRPPSQSSHVSSGEPYKKWQTLGKIPTFAVFCFVLILVFYLRGTLWQRQKRGVWLFVKFIGSALV